MVRVFELSISVIYSGKCDCGERGLVNLYDELTYLSGLDSERRS